MDLEALDHVAVIVRDLEASTRFYTEVLGLRRIPAEVWSEYPVALVAGSSASGVALFPAGAEGVPEERDANVHFAFRTSPAGTRRRNPSFTPVASPSRSGTTTSRWPSTSATRTATRSRSRPTRSAERQ
jgi:hypothetical protein